jgi:hypothetical protein
MKRMAYVLTVALGWAFLSSADGYISLTAQDPGGGSTSFTTGTRWSDGLYPHSDADYLVALGAGTDKVFRTPEGSTNSTFAGRSLTFGIVGGLAGWCNHKTVDGTVTYPDLRLANGRIADGQNGSAWMAGTFSVQAPETAPFRLTGAQNRTFTVIGPISGDVGTGLQISRTEGETGGSFWCRIWGTNTTYKGKWTIDGANIVGEFKSWALGDAPDTMMADAITLKNSGMLAGFSGSVLAPTNRGVTVDSTGGILHGYSVQTWTLDMPVTGAGAVTVDGSGSSKVVFKNVWTAGNITIKSGAGFGILTNATMSESVSITTDGQLGISDTHTGNRLITVNAGGEINPGGFSNIDSVTVSNAVFNGGGVVVDVNTSTGASDCLNLRGNTVVNTWPMTVRIGTDILPTQSSGVDRWAVMTIPTSIKTVTESDFTSTSSFANYAPMEIGFAVTTDADGIQTVYVVRQSSLVQLTKTNLSYTDATIWSDALAAHAGAMYLVRGSMLFRSVQKDNANYQDSFPGDGVILSGLNETASATVNPSLAELRIKCKSFTCTNLVMMAYSMITGGGSDSPQFLRGNITVTDDAVAGARANFGDESGRTFIIDAELNGKGAIRFVSYGNSKANFALTALNTNYTGYTQICGYRQVFAPTNFATLVISDELNLGTNPYAFSSYALSFWNMGKLMVTNDVTIDDANRGVAIDTNGGQIEVGADATLTVIEPLLFNANLTKLGAGTLAIGNTNRMSNGKTMYVKAGAFQPLVCEPVGGLNLNFASGAKFRIAKNPDDAALAQYGMVDGASYTIADTLNVEIDYGAEDTAAMSASFKVPLFCVTTSVADTLRDKIVITNPPNGHFTVSVIEETVTYANNSEYVRFSAVFKNRDGMLIELD